MMDFKNFSEAKDKIKIMINDTFYNAKKERYVLDEAALDMLIEAAYIHGHIDGLITAKKKQETKV